MCEAQTRLTSCIDTDNINCHCDPGLSTSAENNEIHYASRRAAVAVQGQGVQSRLRAVIRSSQTGQVRQVSQVSQVSQSMVEQGMPGWE